MALLQKPLNRLILSPTFSKSSCPTGYKCLLGDQGRHRLSNFSGNEQDIFFHLSPSKFLYNIARAHEYIYLNNGFSPHRSSMSECKAITLITRIQRIGIGNCILLKSACADWIVEILRRRLAFISSTRWIRSDLSRIFCLVFGTCVVIITVLESYTRPGILLTAQ